MSGLLHIVGAANGVALPDPPIYDGGLDADTWYFLEDVAISSIDLSGHFSGTIDSYGATGLPPGFSLDPDTCVLSGTPTTSGSSSASIFATNTGGSDGVSGLPIYVINATGGTLNKINVSGQDYAHWLFTADGTWTPNFSYGAVEYLVVGGGASGGRGLGAGGGGGTDPEQGTTSVTATTGYPVTIGVGGTKQNTTASAGNDGGNSSVFGITNNGGGGGAAGSTGQVGRDGGAGGGGGSGSSAGTNHAGGDGTEANDRDGGSAFGSSTASVRSGGGGGGGDGNGGNAASGVGGAGANGRPINFRGTSINYGGGGGGQSGTVAGAGGNSGTSGGNGSVGTGTATNPNGQTPGSGGGGHNHASQNNGGADGVVEIRVALTA